MDQNKNLGIIKAQHPEFLRAIVFSYFIGWAPVRLWTSAFGDGWAWVGLLWAGWCDPLLLCIFWYWRLGTFRNHPGNLIGIKSKCINDIYPNGFLEFERWPSDLLEYKSDQRYIDPKPLWGSCWGLHDIVTVAYLYERTSRFTERPALRSPSPPRQAGRAYRAAAAPMLSCPFPVRIIDNYL